MKNSSNLFFYCCLLIITFHVYQMPLKAAEKKLKIEQIRFRNYTLIPDLTKRYGLIEYTEIGKDNLPVNLTLKNGLNQIGFVFSRNSNTKYTYRYKLLGKRNQWKYAIATNLAYFEELKHGHYCFVLQELYENKINQEIKYKFFNNLNFWLMISDFVMLLPSILFIYIIFKMKY